MAKDKAIISEILTRATHFCPKSTSTEHMSIPVRLVATRKMKVEIYIPHET
jgi:hypothetical protein